MKITVVGTRGFPNVQGGVETHCENLYPQLVKLKNEVSVFTRKPYADIGRTAYKEVTLISVACPQQKFLEAIIHTFKAVLLSRKLKPHIIHFHALGPSLFVPLARIFGMKSVMTTHGPEYNRKKWNWIAKMVLRMGEWVGCKWANAIISISEPIAMDITKKYHRHVTVIPNGVTIPARVETEYALQKYKLVKGQYIIAVGRFVPEKGFGDLIDAYTRIYMDKKNHMHTDKIWKLLIVGKADHEDEYSRKLINKVNDNSNVILPGFLTGRPLWELYSSAGLFVLPSYYEGLPIVLLEAMSYGLSCIASDIPGNRCLSLAEERYFLPGNIEQIIKKLKNFIAVPMKDRDKENQIQQIKENYDWEIIAKKTLNVYEKVLATKK